MIEHKPWWDKKWNKVCGITQARIRPGKNKNGVPHVVHLPCSHSFYTNALLEWMSQYPESNHSTCPCCRKEFTLQTLIDTI
jgi:hypothetical protein